MSNFFKKLYEKILFFWDKICKNLCVFKERLAKDFHELTDIKFTRKQESKTEESGGISELKSNFAENSTENCEKQIFVNSRPYDFLLNILDIFASLLFISGFVVILKPKLIVRHGISLEQFDQFKIISLSVYTLLKAAIVFYSNKVFKKILPLLLLVISILSYFLLSYSLIMKPNSYQFFIIVSAILCLLSYFAFEYSCGYRSKTLFKKMLSILIIGFVIYIAANFSIYWRKQCLMEASYIFWTEILRFFESF